MLNARARLASFDDLDAVPVMTGFTNAPPITTRKSAPMTGQKS